MKERSGIRLSRLIPCLLIPPLASALFAAVCLTGFFDGVLSCLNRAFGFEYGLDFVFVLFPLLVLLAGVVPAFLLDRRERKIWMIWSAAFFAVFFAVYILVLERGEPDPPRIFVLMWLMLAPGIIVCHLLPAWIVSALRRRREKRKRP